MHRERESVCVYEHVWRIENQTVKREQHPTFLAASSSCSLRSASAWTYMCMYIYIINHQIKIRDENSTRRVQSRESMAYPLCLSPQPLHLLLLLPSTSASLRGLLQILQFHNWLSPRRRQRPFCALSKEKRFICVCIRHIPAPSCPDLSATRP